MTRRGQPPYTADGTPWEQTAKAMNALLILSDEHSRETARCYGNPLVKTPNLDALAARVVVGIPNCPVHIDRHKANP